MAQQTVKSVLRGSLDDLPTLNSRLVRIFISSTFTDTKEERNLLLEKEYPRLKSYCKEKYGLEFQVVDMRWGVPEEASDDHLGHFTMSTGDIQLSETAFLNQKHGHKPIPSSIIDTEFELFLDTLRELGEDTGILLTWFRKDTNSDPAVYVLQTISSIIPEYKNRTEESIKQWNKIQSELQYKLQLVSKKCFEDGKIGEAEKHKYFMSVTEEEIVNGILRAPGQVSDTCVCIVRIIEDIENNLDHQKVARFIDLVNGKVDSEAQKILSDLRDEKIKKRLPSVPRISIKWSEKDGINRDEHSDYLTQFGNLFYTSIKQRIDKAVKDESNMSNLDLYIEIHVKIDKNAIVILRFLGTSPDSSNIWRTFRSICSQIMFNIGEQIKEIPEDFNLLVKFFHDLLLNYKSNRPLILLLDSLDQLNPENGAHQLKWLPKTLPKHVKLILSTYTEGNTIIHLLKSMFPSDNFVSVPKLGEALSEVILKSWLKGQNRTLTQEQFGIVLNAFKHCSLPLYVNLVFEHVLSWRSYTPLDQCRLSATIHESINDLFSRVETKHGKILVSRTFAYITASNEGLSETELEDILSLDDTVLTEVFAYHTPPYRRIPSLLLVRIRYDIMSYLSEKEVDETRVFFWYHRQFFEAARNRYLSDKQFCTSIHSMIADYFLGKWYNVPKPFQYSEKQVKKLGLKSANSEADRKVSAQPIAFTYVEAGKTKKRYNKRMLNRLPYHLSLADRRHELRHHCVYSYSWLKAKITATSVQSVLQDLLMSKKETSRLLKIFKSVQSTLGKNPETLGTEITGHLLPVLGEKGNSEEKKLVEDSLKAAADEWRPIPFQVCYKAPSEALIFKFQHKDMPLGPKLLFVSEDSSHALALAQNNIILSIDLQTGEFENEHQLMDPNITRFNIMFPGKHNTAIIGTSYQKQGNPVYLVNVLTGDVICKLNLEKSYPTVGLVDNLQFKLLEEKIICIHIGKSLDVFERSTGKLLHEFNMPISGVCISHDEKQIVIHSKRSTDITIYSLRTFSIVSEVKARQFPKNVLLMNMGKEAIVYYEDLSTADIINMEPNDGTVGNTLGHLDVQKFGYSSIEDIGVSTDGKYLVIKVEDGFILWNYNANKCHMQCIVPDSLKPEFSVRDHVGYITPDNKFFLVGYEGYILLWDFNSAKLLHQMEVGSSRIVSLIVMPNCKSLITTTWRTNIIYLWELASMISDETNYQPLILNSSPRYLKLNVAGNIALCRGISPTELVVIDVVHGIISKQLAPKMEAMEPMITPDGKYAILRKYNGDEVMTIWDIQTGQLKSTLPLSSDQAKDYTCNNSVLAVYLYASTGDNNMISLWSLPDGKPLDQFSAGKVGLLNVFFAVYDDSVVYTTQGETSQAQLIIYDTKLKSDVFTYDNVLRAQFLQFNNHNCPEILLRESSGLTIIDARNRRVVRKGSGKPESMLSVDINCRYGVDKFRNVYDLGQLKFLFQFDEDEEENIKPSRHTAPKIVPEGTHVLWVNLSAGLLNFGSIKSQQKLGVIAIHSIPVFLQISAIGIVMIGCEDGRIMMLQLNSPGNAGDILNQSILRQKTTKDKSVNMKPQHNKKQESKACVLV
ncbi:hypothetical protein KUTeg_001924 [Tegillarca granosa]|uniref:NACHT and WD repeat domain-containing protein 2 n=1 Tax=Tegillarca granosa TaxID=220873 RepID=A0ABQ9FWI3_TEGGR|nr:hypothetical protein KUTeg_001924 [Tegillarca granosa]